MTRPQVTSVGARQGSPKPYAPLLSFVSGSGGVGKSTLALASAWLASLAGIETALVEADLQFGDYGCWLGLDAGTAGLDSGLSAEPVRLADNLAVYKAPAFPEVAEEVADDVCSLVSNMRRAYGLVICDTGSLWSGLNADLVCNSSLVAVVADSRPASVMSAVRALELCSRIGAASSRCITVYNRYSGKSRLTLKEVGQALGGCHVASVSEGRGIVDSLMSVGAVDDLVASGNPMVTSLDALLCDALPRVGIVYGGAVLRRRRSGAGR